jgi:7-cyano-7-deazaguanine synthase
MCAIVGAIVNHQTQLDCNESNRILNHIFKYSLERGRDGKGFSLFEKLLGETYTYSYRSTVRSEHWEAHEFFTRLIDEAMPAPCLLVGNVRAEPTTEFVKNKVQEDQQPYTLGDWTIVHNGTIANDHELRSHKYPSVIDSAAIVEELDQQLGGPARQFIGMVNRIKGSYAILGMNATEPNELFVAVNYRPIWYARNAQGTFFASSRSYFPAEMTPVMMEPYSVWSFSATSKLRLDKPATLNKRALVVCSGGMDSVVAAKWAINQGYSVELIHFRYGSRAEGPEVDAVSNIADTLEVNVYYHTIDVYDPCDSPLLQTDSTIAGGEAGAEFAHEWVPARNLLMLATATAIAEAKGFDYLVLGNNLEEAGAYPDNEPEFINRFNDMLPFAIGDGKHLKVIMPVGNMMKHEIVELGVRIGAPLHLTWSCYRAGELHCGTCGPCYMRRTAFAINNIQEVISYEGE